MITEKEIVRQFKAGKTIDGLADIVYAAAKADYTAAKAKKEDPGERVTRYKARHKVELAIYNSIMQKNNPMD